MKIGEIEIKWEMGDEAAADLLQAVQTLADTSGIQRVDGTAFKAYKIPGQGIRIDLASTFYSI